MSLTRKIAHNTMVQIVGKSIATLLGVVAVAIMIRYLGPEGFGQYTTIIAFLQFFGIVMDFGLNVMVIQMISEIGENKEEQDKIVSNIFTIRFFSAVIFLGLAPLVVLFFPYPSIIKIGVAITTLSFFCIILWQILNGVFQKHLRMDKSAIAEVAGRIALVVFILLAVLLKLGLLGVMAAVVLGSFINFLLLYIFSRAYVRIKFVFDFPFWKKILLRSWPTGLSVVFNLIYLKADVIILSLYRSQAEVGIYGAPYRVLEILIMFPIMFVGIILPLLSAAWAQQNRERFKQVLQKAFDFLSMMAVPLVVGTMFLGTPVMVLLGDLEFAISGPVLKVLIFACGLVFVGTLFAHAIVALNKQRQMVWAYAITAILTLIGYLIFIPRYGYWGAAWMTVFSEGFLSLIAFIVVCWAAKVFPSFKMVGKALLASMAMAVFLYFMADHNLWLLVFSAIIIYFAALYMLRGFSEKLIKEILTLRN